MRFIRGDSQADEFKEQLHGFDTFDLALVDGDHAEDGCRADFLAVKDRANVVVLHDIVSDQCPGVVTVWNEIKEHYADEYEVAEFIDQYPDVLERTGHGYLGTGVAVRKSYLETL